MKKLLFILIVGSAITAGVSYFGMQWKVDQILKDVTNTVRPFIDIDYESVNIGLDGRININNLSFYEVNSASNITIDSIGLSTSNLLETLQLERSFNSGRLPKSLAMDVRGLDLDIPSEVFRQFNAMYPASKASQILALGCGEIDALGAMQFYDLGFSNVMMDIEVGYVYEMVLDEFVTTSVLSIDGMGAIETEHTLLGLLEVMDNYKSVTSFDFSNVVTQKMVLNIRDYGFNNKLVDYCARKAGLKNDEWRELNANMVMTAFKQFDVRSSFDLQETYREFIHPGIEVSATLQPISNIEQTNLEPTSLSEMIRQTNLEVTVNGRNLDLKGLSYDAQALEQLNLRAVRLAHNKGISIDIEPEPEQKVVTPERKLIDIPSSELSRYVGRKFSIERTDGQLFTGNIISFSDDQVVIRARQGTGYTDLPVNIDQIEAAALYPEL